MMSEFETNERGFRLHLTTAPEFPDAPTKFQRDLLLKRTFAEMVFSLNQLNILTKRFVTGSNRPEMQADLAKGVAVISDEELIIEGQQVMQLWQLPLMRAMVSPIIGREMHVLEVGFGLGISADLMQQGGVASHTIVECNPDVFASMKSWRQRYPDSDITLIEGDWRTIQFGKRKLFDALFFDPYPFDENDFQKFWMSAETFASQGFDFAASVLKAGGVFVYFTNEIDSVSRLHQRAILDRFTSYNIRVVKMEPPVDCQYWWADSIVVAAAYK